MEYLIVDQPNPSFLICKVNEFIKTGWKPAGGVSAYVDLERPHFTHFMQAMINEEKNEGSGVGPIYGGLHGVRRY